MVATRQDIQGQIQALLGDVKRDIDVARARRIFCNRNLRMAHAELIGFDMDYTLALYHQDKLEQLSMELTLRKLVENHGYPDAIQSLSYDSRLAIRGVVIDRNLGNVFKMDRHGHVGRVFHGLTKLSKDERDQQYHRTRIRLSSPRYAWIDTLFGLPEAVMYMTLVDYFEHSGRSFRFRQLFDDIRASIDEAHRDDTLKTVIKADMPSYVHKDPRLAETLHKLRSSGKKLFLLDQLAVGLHQRGHELPARRRAQGVPVVAQLLRLRHRRRQQAGLLHREAAVLADRPGRGQADRRARQTAQRATRSTRAATSSTSRT